MHIEDLNSWLKQKKNVLKKGRRQRGFGGFPSSVPPMEHIEGTKCINFPRDTWRGTIACLARNTTGNIEFGRNTSIVAPSIPIVKALSLRATISLGRNLGQTKIVPEYDSRDLVTREGNKDAHSLTQMVSWDALYRGWCLRLPPQLRLIVDQDCALSRATSNVGPVSLQSQPLQLGPEIPGVVS
ncbi:Endonuclease/exonuclease/phosphatase [Sesbania bispinosa]|nr:Endonuclease/exonuclease/phosphatase [Sesbania bispinosa]